MNILPSRLPGVLLLEPRVYEDLRGIFFESWNERDFERCGLAVHFVQDNHTRSRKGVLRGLHYQIRQPQAKLVRVVAGEIFDVTVDVRRSSPFFGKWEGVRLSAHSRTMIWIPEGFAHGFLALSEAAEVIYKVTSFHAPEHERCILWNDPDLAIDWPLSGEPTLSAKDAAGSRLRDVEVFP